LISEINYKILARKEELSGADAINWLIFII